MPLPEAPASFDWTIRTKTDPNSFRIHAAYFKDESGFIRFKDTHHTTMYLIASDSVLDIGRLAEADDECPKAHEHKSA
jgi:hypothetical protein